MKNWQKYRNFRKKENADGSFTYTIRVYCEVVEVSEEVYQAYAQGGYKMENMEFGLKCDRILQDAEGRAVRDADGLPCMFSEREVSLDKLINDGWDYPSSEPSPEENVIRQLEINMLYSCLGLLDSSEKELILALFFDGLTEREYAKKLDISKTALHFRKNKILAKLKKLINQ